MLRSSVSASVSSEIESMSSSTRAAAAPTTGTVRPYHEPRARRAGFGLHRHKQAEPALLSLGQGDRVLGVARPNAADQLPDNFGLTR